MIKKSVLLMGLWCLLSGCVPIAVVVGATVGGAILYDTRSYKTISNDNKAKTEAIQSIRSKQSLQGKVHVKVAIYNGIGLVIGSAKSEEDKAEIGHLVATTGHVRRVYNEIEVREKNGVAKNLNDAWLASKVRADLLLKPGMRSTSIRIEANAGTIYLMGVVNHKQADLAANTASQVVGVKRVVKLFEYDMDR